MGSQGTAVNELLFTIPIDTTDVFGPQIQEVIVASNFTVIRFDNSTI